jgi:transcriptional regulator with XRE-family HTH domain
MLFHQKLRELKGEMTEAALHKATGIPAGTLHNYLLGRRLPGYGAVVKIAEALGADCRAFSDCDDLLEGAPIPKKKRKKK